jgi:hypothetical protein
LIVSEQCRHDNNLGELKKLAVSSQAPISGFC